MAKGLKRPALKEGVLQQIADELKRVLVEKELVAQVRGPALTAVLMADGTYKQKAIQPDVELLFKGVRLGARSPLVFEFEPMGAHEFTQVEFEEEKLLQLIPQIEPTLVSALGLDEGLSWRKAKIQFVDEAEKRAAEAEELREIEAMAANELDPEWGMF